MPRHVEIVKNDPPVLDDFAVQRAHGADLAVPYAKPVTIEGTMPGGGINRVEIAVCSIPALLAMKGYAVANRAKQKDAYDIYYCVRNYPGGPEALAEVCRPLLDEKSAQEGYACIAEKFTTVEHTGPVWVRQFAEGQKILGESTPEQWQQDAFGQVDAWLTVFRTRPSEATPSNAAGCRQARGCRRGFSGMEGSRPRVTACWMMACFCSLSSTITFRFARIVRSSRPFAQSRNRTIAACSVGEGTATGILLKCEKSRFWRSPDLRQPEAPCRPRPTSAAPYERTGRRVMNARSNAPDTWIPTNAKEWYDWLVEEERRTVAAYCDKPSLLIAEYHREQDIARDYEGREILELLQNANDQAAERGERGRVLIELSQDGLIVSNTGLAFSVGGVGSLQMSHLSPKRRRRRQLIGNKGLGFRSVLNWSRTPVILSSALSLTYCQKSPQGKTAGADGAAPDARASGHGRTADGRRSHSAPTPIPFIFRGRRCCGTPCRRACVEYVRAMQGIADRGLRYRGRNALRYAARSCRGSRANRGDQPRDFAFCPALG